MINPHELNSSSQHRLTEWHARAAMQALAQAAQGRTECEAHPRARNGIVRRLAGWLANVRVARRANTNARSY